jgi:phosphatidylserine/phosphatidylglycerophosphate/cardiolipin synthase-like enzyme
MADLEADFLDPGTRPAQDVASELAAWIGEANRSLSVAIYDFHAASGSSARVADALEAAQRRGVKVRVAFNMERLPVPSAPRPPRADPNELEGLEVPTRGVHSAQGSLMHHKYVVRDDSAVWTGSLNWTDDAFGLEENVILRVASSALAAAYVENFEELWAKQTVESSGGSGPQVAVGDGTVQPFFSPRGPSLAHLAAERLAHAKHRIRLLSPVVTSGAILGTLAEIAPHRGFDFGGAVDLTQMEEVHGQWAGVPTNRWKIEAWADISPRLAGKRSTPYAEGSVHDYMHAKAVLADGSIVAGSYNLSKGGEHNAENVLLIKGGPLVEQLAEYADRVGARYGNGPTAQPAR